MMTFDGGAGMKCIKASEIIATMQTSEAKRPEELPAIESHNNYLPSPGRGKRQQLRY